MTHHVDVARGRDTVARWCNLAERRLEYLTELFETGRWRRYYSEVAFLQNIQEAKAAVETWRALMNRKASLDNSAMGLNRLDGNRTSLPPDEGAHQPLQRHQAQPTPIIVEPQRDIPADVLVALENQLAAASEVPVLPDAPALDDLALPALDLDVMQVRYPLLRNAL